MLDFPRRPDLILLVEGRNYSPSKFLEQITLDFDQLCEEAGRRPMMSVSAGRLTLRWVWPRTGVPRAPRWRHLRRSRSRQRHPQA